MAKRRKGEKRKTQGWRDSWTLATVSNSGLEVWLYDDANRESIIESGGTRDLVDEKLTPLFADGRLAAYSLFQDDEVHVAVVVGALPAPDDLAQAAWLTPQTAFLSLPTGQLCIESNDASRIGPDEPGHAGARIAVPAGDYRLTLYRIDYEALARAEREWNGPQELIVLTPGGGPADAATEILPFNLARDTSWVGQYTIAGRTLKGLVWFDDSWDTFTVNIDSRAIEALQIKPGTCLRTTVPDLGISLVSVFAASWKEARDLEPPSGFSLDEYGFAALTRFQDWDRAEGLYCRRDRTKTAIREPHKHLWLPASVDVLETTARAPERIRGPLLHDAGARAFWRGDLRERHYYNDLQLLTARLMGRAEGVPWGELLPLARAIQFVDEAMAPLGLHQAGEFSFDVQSRQGPVEYTNRLYCGLPDIFAVIWGSRDVFDVFFYSLMQDGTWALTGTITKTLAEMISARNGLSVRAGAGRFAAVLEAHRAHVADAGGVTRPAPAGLTDGVVLYEAYLKTALD